nr:hypothetical protein CFP56_79205 [Quercus suber]
MQDMYLQSRQPTLHYLDEQYEVNMDQQRKLLRNESNGTWAVIAHMMRYLLPLYGFAVGRKVRAAGEAFPRDVQVNIGAALCPGNSPSLYTLGENSIERMESNLRRTVFIQPPIAVRIRVPSRTFEQHSRSGRD